MHGHSRRWTTAFSGLSAVALTACALLVPLSDLSNGPPDAGPADVTSEPAPDPDRDTGSAALPDAPGAVEAGRDGDADAGGLCPCSLFGDTFAGEPLADDPQPVDLGVRFSSDVPAHVVAIRFYKGGAANAPPHVGTMWTAGGTKLFSGTFGSETESGWQTLNVSPPVPVAPGTEYVAAYHTDVGLYSNTPSFFLAGYDAPPLHASPSNGVFTYDGGMPGQYNAGNNYWVDVVITTP